MRANVRFILTIIRSILRGWFSAAEIDVGLARTLAVVLSPGRPGSGLQARDREGCPRGRPSPRFGNPGAGNANRRFVFDGSSLEGQQETR